MMIKFHQAAKSNLFGSNSERQKAYLLNSEKWKFIFEERPT
jgi:hypothetical protein